MRQPRLLVIDDEPALAEFVAQVAAECGFDPILTGNDEDFRAAVVAERPDVVLSISGCPEWTESSCSASWPRKTAARLS